MRTKLNRTGANSLLLYLEVPWIFAEMATAVIDAVHAREGELMPVGAKLLDLTVDLSADAPHDCPPISRYRLVLRDQVWLRRLDVAPGDERDVGASLALFSTEPDESLEPKPKRAVRFATAGILAPLPLGD